MSWCRSTPTTCRFIGSLQILAHHGVTIERATLAQWVGAAANELQPLHDRLLQQLKASPEAVLRRGLRACPVLDIGLPGWS